MSFEIKENKNTKVFRSPTYNYNFDKVSGFFARWGKTKEEDPQFAPFPEILDIEISSSNSQDTDTISDRVSYSNNGCHGLGCQGLFCYKANKRNKSVHMTLDTFKSVLNKFSKQNGIHLTTQIAFGVLSPINQHPQVWEIFQECRNQGIIPNVTINEILTDETANKLKELCGAVAISINPVNKEYAYNSVKKLTDLGMDQINFHIVLSDENIDFIKMIADDTKSDIRLSKLNAIVMLAFKDKAKTNAFTNINKEKYNRLINELLDNKIRIGFDSCSAWMFKNAVNNNPELCQCSEECCATRFSAYINVFGFYFPCSFLEGENEWCNGIDILQSDQNWWNCDRIQEYRKYVLNRNKDRKNPCNYV